MTYQTPTCSTADDRPATKPTEEIEVTPEMIEAATCVVVSWLDDRGVGFCELVAEQALAAAIAARGHSNLTKVSS